MTQLNNWLLLLGLSCLLFGSSCYACTLFGATGSVVDGGGTIIAKNRDFIPEPQKVKVVRNGKYAYFALFSQAENGNWYIRAGVNEKGLVAVTAMASCLPEKQRMAGNRKPILSYILRNCATVQEALAEKDKFVGAKFLMLGDSVELANVEMGLNGKYHIETVKNNTLAHTNYYLQPEFRDLNIKVGESSKTRYERICELLDKGSKPLNLQQFWQFSQDVQDGLDNSLWRLGSEENNIQTLTSFIVKILPNDDFEGVIKYRKQVDEQGKEEVLHFSKKEIFKQGKDVG